MRLRRTSADVPQIELQNCIPPPTCPHQRRFQPALADPDEPVAECRAGDGAGRRITSSPTRSKFAELIELRVRDTGSGIPADILPHVFEPFFTTKRGQRHRARSQHHATYVRSHGGDIQVESIPGYGTTVRVTLPIRQAGKLVQHSRGGDRLAWQHSILIVDDEALTLRTIGRALRPRLRGLLRLRWRRGTEDRRRGEA